MWPSLLGWLQIDLAEKPLFLSIRARDSPPGSRAFFLRNDSHGKGRQDTLSALTSRYRVIANGRKAANNWFQGQAAFIVDFAPTATSP
jgi:hypothetical protein